MSKSKYTYKEADKYIVINDNDPDLRPIYLSLPKPPPLHMIDGYGLPHGDQRFERVRIPTRLKELEAEALRVTKIDVDSNKNTQLDSYKIQKNYWKLLYGRHKEIKKEIDFIRKTWWHRIHGYWFFNNGKPTYITGTHYFYLNFWSMDTNDGENRPAYRERDMKEFIFLKYCATTTHTFTRLDKDGYAIPEDDGTYKMTNLKRRVCYGTVQSKNRRSGNTNKSLSAGLELITRTLMTDGMGIQSYSNDNAKEHFMGKLMPAFDKLPMFFKPKTTSGRSSSELKFELKKNDFGNKALNTKVTYATTSSEKFFDGKKMMFLLLDEQGKDARCSILKRWDVNRNCLSQGNGVDIHGLTMQPSTVDEIDATESAYDYRFLCQNSNFYRRYKTTGQSYSGLFRIFVPATEGLDEFIDSHGNSVAKEITESQEKEGFTQTSTEYLQGKRDDLLADGSPEAMRAYREEKKLFPLLYGDSWTGESGDIGFPIEDIDTRISEIRRESTYIRGKLEWVDDVYGGDVKFIRDDENGMFFINEIPPDGIMNKKVRVEMFHFKEGKTVPMWRPIIPTRGVIGADPYRQIGEKDAKYIGGKTGRASRLSDGGIAGYLCYDESVDGGVPRSQRKYTDRFVLSYRHRYGNLDDYCEDVLKAAIWTGFMVYPETNLDDVWMYFLDNGFGAYLLYDINKVTGVIKDKPGVDSLERSKQTLFNKLRDYLDYRVHQDDFEPFLQECKDIKGMEQMRRYDRLTSHGLCLMGADSPYVNSLARMENNEYDYDDFLWT